MCRRFGLVVNATASPSSRMREELSDFKWTPGRLLTVIPDCEPALPNLIRNATNGDGEVRHILDWRDISMRGLHVEAAVQGLVQTPGFAGILVLFQRPAKSLRWWLWLGRARVAETYPKGLMHDCADLTEEPLAVRTAATPVQACCETLYPCLANNMEPALLHKSCEGFISRIQRDSWRS